MRRRLGICVAVTTLLVSGVASAQTPKCEEQLPIVQKLLQSIAGQRSQYEIENAQLKVQVDQLAKDVQDARATMKKDTSKK